MAFTVMKFLQDVFPSGLLTKLLVPFCVKGSKSVLYSIYMREWCWDMAVLHLQCFAWSTGGTVTLHFHSCELRLCRRWCSVVLSLTVTSYKLTASPSARITQYCKTSNRLIGDLSPRTQTLLYRAVKIQFVGFCVLFRALAQISSLRRGWYTTARIITCTSLPRAP